MNITGKWIYRSFNNDPHLVGGDANKALALIFGEGTMTITVGYGGALHGTFDMGGGYLMDLSGLVKTGTNPLTLTMEGKGHANSPTAGWIYDYIGFAVPAWPHGVHQRDAIVGSTIRAVPHNGQPAGVTASIIMVRA